MKVAVLFSGGKDSGLALHKAKLEGHEIVYLLNVFPTVSDSFMFHKPNLDLLGKQAEELGIELLVQKSKGEEERELVDLGLLLKEVKGKVEGIVVGGIASSYQGKRIKKLCDDLGFQFIAPLWDFKPEEVWEELLDSKFKIVLTKISAEGLGGEWIGKEIGKKEIGELKKLAERFKFRIDFEGGEAESAVLWMPGFRDKKSIKIDFTIESEGEYRHFMNIKKIR